MDLREEKYKNFWNCVGDVAEGRGNLGEEMPVSMYRLFQYTLKDVLDDRFTKEAADDIFREAGKRAGYRFAEGLLNLDLEFDDFTAHVQQVLEENKVGILHVEQFDPDTGNATLTIGEDLDCSGLPVTGETVCTYDEGFLQGILEKYTHNKYKVIEVDCWATGSRVCRFKASVDKKRDSNEQG